MSALYGDQTAEPPAEDKHRPDPQRAAHREEGHAKPANDVLVEGQDRVPVSVGGQVCTEQSNEPEGDKDPAVGTILSLAGA